MVTEKTHKRACLVWPRRAGKDLTALNILAWHALIERVGNYYYFLPSYTQGEKVIWDGKRGDGESFLNVFPEEMIESVDNRKMKIKLANGSLFQVVGAGEADDVVGTNPIGCVFSEYSIQSPKFWDYIRPILAENDGFAIFTYTARGLNHGWRLYETTKNHPKWFTEFRTCENVIHNGKRTITDEIINEERTSGMSEEKIRSEFYNDFYASNHGAYYAKEMRLLHDSGRYADVPYDPAKEVHTAWDLGVRDACAIWFFQVDYAGNVNVIDAHSDSNIGMDSYIKTIKAKPYIYGTHFAPHDIKQREFSTGRSRMEIALELGVRFQPLPKLSIQDGIDSARMLLARCRFDKTKCFEGVEALRQYHKMETGQADMHGTTIFRNQPNHDHWSSHYADAFRYLATAINKVMPSTLSKDEQEYGRVFDMPDTAVYDEESLFK